MKKILLLMALVPFGIAVTGCSGEEIDDPVEVDIEIPSDFDDETESGAGESDAEESKED